MNPFNFVEPASGAAAAGGNGTGHRSHQLEMCADGEQRTLCS